MDEALDFYRKAFGATEHFRLTAPDGRVGHAEIYLGNKVLMLAEEFPEMGITAPKQGDNVSISLHLHVDDADVVYSSAVAAGATSIGEPTDQFHGERMCTVKDPFGYRWMIGHSIEDDGIEEMQSRYSRLG